ELIQREFITERLQTGISYAEFSYSLIQGYDYWQLYKDHNVVLQIGGSDQWGNMLSGVALVRKKEAKEVQALSMPLIIDKATGRKFGKSEAGAIWLDPARTSPYQFYQFWLNTPDEDAEDYLKTFTLLDRVTIGAFLKAAKIKPADRIPQKKLAFEVTALVHGEAQAKRQEHIARAVFDSQSFTELDDSEMAVVRQEMPNIKAQPGTPAYEILVKAGLAASNSEARRLVQAAATYVNGAPFKKDHIESSDFINGRLIFRRGKSFKDSALVELE
ncbi:MAG TPA: tyrosine--tRNA ligase, partial [Candidatus Saccharimonadales bacterium]|nr:tyrosine--tRNA ligase [Candidatus Saccharimonadales bacterium]